ncbi:MAG: hypothetical protein LBH62_09275 [Nitrososphaerota archaeon]|jgi:hypothetical protein|nr:hypothetical protein [Nitrososphaerota archaeon]
MSELETAILKQISTLTKVHEVEDQKTLRKLLIDGKAYCPQEGYVIATTPLITSSVNDDEKPTQTSAAVVAGVTERGSIWEARIPKPKHKGDTPIPYEFCSYTNYAELPSDILRVTREVSFMEWIEHNGYKYKRITGGVMRRPIN